MGKKICKEGKERRGRTEGERGGGGRHHEWSLPPAAPHQAQPGLIFLADPLKSVQVHLSRLKKRRMSGIVFYIDLH